jgi:hypothetical protein
VRAGEKVSGRIGTRIRRLLLLTSLLASNSGRKVRSIVEESLTLFKAREVLKWRTEVEVESAFCCSRVVGRFDCATAVLKARELVISSAERREMSCAVLVLILERDGFDVVAYILLVAVEIDLPPFAFVAKTRDVVWEVHARSFLGEDIGGICCRTGHVQVADLVGATREVAESDELDGSGSGHCGCLKACVEVRVRDIVITRFE